jgi:heme/copper-type cytochrome/quinol oxidase subunit 4
MKPTGWVEEEKLRKKYMVGFIISTIVNLIMFGVIVT